MKHFTNQSSSLCSLHGKIGIQMNNTVTHQKRKIMNFLLKNLPLQNIVPHLMFIILNFIHFWGYLKFTSWTPIFYFIFLKYKATYHSARIQRKFNSQICFIACETFKFRKKILYVQKGHFFIFGS